MARASPLVRRLSTVAHLILAQLIDGSGDHDIVRALLWRLACPAVVGFPLFQEMLLLALAAIPYPLSTKDNVPYSGCHGSASAAGGGCRNNAAFVLPCCCELIASVQGSVYVAPDDAPGKRCVDRANSPEVEIDDDAIAGGIKSS